MADSVRESHPNSLCVRYYKRICGLVTVSGITRYSITPLSDLQTEANKKALLCVCV